MNIFDVEEKLETFHIIVDRLEYIIDQEQNNKKCIKIFEEAKNLISITDIDRELIESVINFVKVHYEFIWNENSRVCRR